VDSSRLIETDLPNGAYEEVRMELDSGNHAVLKGGLVYLYLSNGQELFSVDANSLAFEKKLLGAAMQIYLLGFNRGKTNEQARIKTRVQSALGLVFD